jgi:ferredoxin-type protein NapH
MKDAAIAIKKRRWKQLLTFWILPFVSIGGWSYPLLGYFIPLCMVAGLGIAVFRGRNWCDWLCPRGSFWDIALSPISFKRKIPLIFRNSAFRIIIMSILMLVLLTQLPRYWPSVEGMGRVFVVMLSVTTVVGIILGIFIHPRTWCSICPIGTMANWIGKGTYPLMIDTKCTTCKICDTVCPTQLDRWPYLPEQGEAVIVPEWDCLKCGLCVEACPRQSLTLER